MIYPRHTYIIVWDIDHDDYSIRDFQAEMRNLNAVIRIYEFRQSHNNPAQGLVRAGDMKASLTNWKDARRGDRFFLYMVSEKEEFKNRIVGSGFFYTEPYLVKRNGEIFSMFDLDFDVMIDPEKDYKLLTEEVLELQFPDFDWSGKTPDFVLDTDTAWQFEAKWYRYLFYYNPECSENKFWCRSPDRIYSMYSWSDDKNEQHCGRAMRYWQSLHFLKKIVLINNLEEAEKFMERLKKKYKKQNNSTTDEKDCLCGHG